MTGLDYDICETQGKIYELAATNLLDLKSFSDQYLASDFCKRAMDSRYSRFQLADEEECWDFILPEIGGAVKPNKEDGIFDPDVAFWIGFTYRHISLDTGIYSSELGKDISFEAMCRYYPGLHTVDEDMALDIVKKDFLARAMEKVSRGNPHAKY